jgi:hypothetical protein
MLQLILIALLIAMSLAGCSNEYDMCIERQKEEYRQRNPKASYGQTQSKQQEFEMMCSSLKKK